MGKRDRKKSRHSSETAPKAEAQQQPIDAGGSSKRTRLMVWLVAVLAVAATVVTWTILTKERFEPIATSAEQQSVQTTEATTSVVSPEAARPDSGVSAARLEIREPEFDFGYVPQEAKVSHVFWLHSAGEDTLRILKVNPG